MKLGELEIPTELQALISSGWWPQTQEEAQSQNFQPLIANEKVRVSFPNEHRIFFYPPPFRLFSEEVELNSDFWKSPVCAISEIQPHRAIDIGDFGPGSDTALLLDYRSGDANPSVIYLCYEENRNEAHWKECASTFGEFIDELGIEI